MKIDLNRVLEIEALDTLEDRIYEAALMYVRQGIRVLPLVPNGKMLPGKNDGGINYQSASNKVETVNKWFKPGSGRYAGHNLGIATGYLGGVFAVDVDCKGGKNGIETFDGMLEKNGSIDCPMAITPSGGRHYLMEWEQNAASSTEKIANGIDTRGGEKDRSTGHIVAWPSLIDKKPYKWARGGEIPTVPFWIMDAMGVQWSKPRNTRSGEYQTLEEIIPEGQMARMLSHIKVDDLEYDEWVKIGMALKTQYPGDGGLEIWDEWSRTGRRYKRGECHVRWSGFDEEGMVRMGTIFYHAVSGGWEAQEGDITPFTANTKIEIAVAEMNKEYAVVCIGKNVKIIRVMDMSKVDKRRRAEAEYESHKIMDVDAFNVLAAPKKILVFEGDKMKQKSLASIWLSHPSRREYIHGTGFYPNGDVPDGKFNLWQGFSVDPAPGEPELYLWHVRNIICHEDDALFNWVIDWMADAVQDTANPKGCAIIVRGTEGIGKGVFFDCFGKLFGHHYKHLLDIGHLTGNFNAHMAGAAFVFADEVFWPGNRQAANKFKGIITEKRILLERKGVDVETMDNMAHVGISSNEDWVVPAGPESRRWLVLECSKKKRGDKDYFKRLVESMDHHGLSKLLGYLQRRKITSNLSKAPETLALQVQRNIEAESHDPVSIWIKDRLDRGCFETPDVKQEVGDDSYWPTRVPAGAFYREFVDWSKMMGFRGREIRSPELFKMSLEKNGFVRTRGAAGIFYKVPAIDALRKKFSTENHHEAEEQES